MKDKLKDNMIGGYCDIIFIAGAPGTGKTSVSQLLQKEFGSPCFEFGWIPEFRQKGNKTIGYAEEEGIAFENLVLVTKNYIRHGFSNIIVTDLEDRRIMELHQRFQKQKYTLFTLTVSDNEILKSRIMDETRTSEYRDWKTARGINERIISRSLLPNEVRIDTTRKPVSDVAKEIIAHLEGAFA